MQLSRRPRTRRACAWPLGAALLAAALLSTAPARADAASDARPLGTFTMSGRVTVAVRVLGEQRGETLARRWTLAPSACAGSVCRALLLTRERAAGAVESLVLRRTAPGVFSGRGAFRLALSCRGRVFRAGEYVPYRIVLAVAAAQTVQSISFATAITARYENRVRKGLTRCPLGPSHDAAVYTGAAAAPPPAPPQAAFSVAVEPGTRTAHFAGAAVPSPGGGAIVAYAWDFGDPQSGAADRSGEAQPVHAFTTPGPHLVTLTVTDANGLSTTTSQQLVL